jgi:hypothetical protein
MKESHGKGVANRPDLEPCVGVCKGAGEASAEVCAGRPSSRENVSPRGADALRGGGRPHPPHRHREMRQDLARSETPSMRRTILHGNREIRWSTAGEGSAVRVGKSKDPSPR